MTADDDVLNFNYVHRKLYDGKTIQVRVHNNIGNIAMNKYFARWQVYDLVGWHSAV